MDSPDRKSTRLNSSHSSISYAVFCLKKKTLSGFVTQNVSLFLTLTFLAHQTLLSLSAIIRSLLRRMVTGKRLLEWQTAAEAELCGHRRTHVDVYLDWSYALAVAVAVGITFVHPRALLAAFPILALFFFLMIRPPPISTLFPYTTLFRSDSLQATNLLLRVTSAEMARRTTNRSVRLVMRARAVFLGFVVFCFYLTSSANALEVPLDANRSEEHTSELQSQFHLVCRLLLEK